MRPIQMVDTQTQYQKIKREVDASIQQVLDSSAYIGGKIVQEFALNLAKYLDVRYVVPCANGTDALQIAMMALDLQPGDEVITPSYTYIATTEVVALLRLTPVFVEVDQKTFCIDPAAIRKAITPNTKAIVPVHLYGHAANMEEIMNIAREFNLHVIEDNAQTIGADYIFKNGVKQKTGTIGTIGTTSFYPSKNLGAFGDGGAIYTNDDELVVKMKMIVNHGVAAPQLQLRVDEGRRNHVNFGIISEPQEDAWREQDFCFADLRGKHVARVKGSRAKLTGRDRLAV